MGTNNAPEQPFPSLRWVWALRDAEDVSPRLKDLAMLMFSYADRQGQTRPTIATLRLAHVKDGDDKRDGGEPWGERTIQRRRAELVKLGWFTLVSKGVGRGQASVYTLSFPPGTTRENASIDPGKNTSIELPENTSITVALSETGSETDSEAATQLHTCKDSAEGKGSSPFGTTTPCESSTTFGNSTARSVVPTELSSHSAANHSNRDGGAAQTIAEAWAAGDEVAKGEFHDVVQHVLAERVRHGLSTKVDGGATLDSLRAEYARLAQQW